MKMRKKNDTAVYSTGTKVIRFLVVLLMSFVAFLTLYPIFYVVLGAFKKNQELLTGGINIFPSEWIVQNFIDAWNSANFAVYTGNSIFLALSVMILTLVVTSMAGYVFARKNFRGKELIYGLFVAFMFVNVGSVTLRPLFELAVKIHMNTSLWSAYMVPLLEEDCQKAGVQMMLNTTATEILTDDNGAAVGIKATGASGETITINAKAVILTSGGFGANMDMVVEYKPELKGFMTTNAPGILGQGIKMAQAIGADTVDMDQIQIHPTVQYDSASLITEGLRGDGAVLINSEGKRFIDEVGTRDVVSAAEIAQTGSYSWLVVDQAMVDASSVIQGYIKKGYTVTGETYEELGKAMGVDEAAFAETMNTWNGYVEAKNDPDFGRTSFANKLDTAPYYAIKVTAGVHHTMGGLKINTNTEVLNENGEVIPGLFAAGEVTGGVHGANRLGGTAVSDFVVFGRIAGAAASKYAA